MQNQIPKPANNKYYFKAFNEDYRIGGIFHLLDNSEFRLMIILQAYANELGNICNLDGRPYSKAQLSKIAGLNFRTLDKAMDSLIDSGLLINSDGIITLTNFLYDNNDRDKSKNSEAVKKRDYAIKQNIANRKARNATINAIIQGQNATNLKVQQMNDEIKSIAGHK